MILIHIYFIVTCLPTPHLETSFCCVRRAQWNKVVLYYIVIVFLDVTPKSCFLALENLSLTSQRTNFTMIEGVLDLASRPRFRIGTRWLVHVEISSPFTSTPILFPVVTTKALVSSFLWTGTPRISRQSRRNYCFRLLNCSLSSLSSFVVFRTSAFRDLFSCRTNGFWQFAH